MGESEREDIFLFLNDLKNGFDVREEKMIPKTSHYTQEQLQRLGKLSKLEGIGEAILLREALDMLLKKYDV